MIRDDKVIRLALYRGCEQISERYEAVKIGFGEGDVVIIPAGVAHGFSEITEAITYMVVRVDPEKLVALK